MNHINEHASKVKPYAELAPMIITELRRYLTQDLPGLFFTDQTQSESSSLHISYFGYKMVVRVEIAFWIVDKKLDAQATVAAYHIVAGPISTEKKLLAYMIDPNGNIHGKYTSKDFSGVFIRDVFIAALNSEEGMVLRP